MKLSKIIKKAINSGYGKDRIIILDTDLSLSENFVKEYGAWVTILIPSIDFPGISQRFLLDCSETHTSFKRKKENMRIFIYAVFKEKKFHTQKCLQIFFDHHYL